MSIEKKNLFTNIVYSFSIIFYLVIGVGVLTISHFDFSERTPLLSALIILSSVPHVLIYAANREKKSYLIISAFPPATQRCHSWQSVPHMCHLLQS